MTKLQFGVLPANVGFAKIKGLPSNIANPFRNLLETKINIPLYNQGPIEEDVQESVDPIVEDTQESIDPKPIEEDDYSVSLFLNNSVEDMMKEGYKSDIDGFSKVDLSFDATNKEIVGYLQSFDNIFKTQDLEAVFASVPSETASLLKAKYIKTRGLTVNGVSFNDSTPVNFLEKLKEATPVTLLDSVYNYSMKKEVGNNNVMKLILTFETKNGKSISSNIPVKKKTLNDLATGTPFTVGGINLDWGSGNASGYNFAEKSGIPIGTSWSLAKDVAKLEFKYEDGGSVTINPAIAKDPSELGSKQTSLMINPLSKDEPDKLYSTLALYFDTIFQNDTKGRKAGDANKIVLTVDLNVGSDNTNINVNDKEKSGILG
tara:strand:- start:3571 stop:4692 length:1122 start_codon:yes stop_codon:yes gene_type:complete